MKLRGAGGIIESGQVAVANLKTLNETIHPWVLSDCPDLFWIGCRCRRAGCSFEWQPFSDHPVMQTPDGNEVKLVNILGVPYFMEVIEESDASPGYHAYVADILSMAGRSANEHPENSEQESQPGPGLPMLPALSGFLDKAGGGRSPKQVAPPHGPQPSSGNGLT